MMEFKSNTYKKKSPVRMNKSPYSSMKKNSYSKKSTSNYTITNDVRHADKDVDKRSKMFKMFSRR